MIVPAVILIVAGLGLKVAAPLTAAGGVVFTLGGLLTLLLPKSTAGPVLLGSALAAAAICIVGGLRGVRACRAL